LIIDKKNYFELKKKGFSAIKIDASLKRDILENIKLKIKKLLKNKFKNNLNKINNIEDKVFIRNFGNVSQRFFEFKLANKFNEILKSQFKDNLNLDVTMHNPTKSNKKFNKKLTKKDFSFYWRIVRVNKDDVGKPHNDEQFWKLLSKKELKFNYKIKNKIKIWIPLYGVTKQNSLRVLNKKYYDKRKLTISKINGMKKPNIDQTWFDRNKKNFTQCTDGKHAILFDYKTIHYAPKNNSKNIRISCEATIIIR
jgi:hypothetical protein|tara:strand:- start:3344 stop:4099 length:756 start_codon:yes stop_codon:yes gene_type:complete